ncbi:MAG: pantetheine-phosphate adenylyltransferase [Actinobacteria bacterium]|nr:pantetheine-phosphate adenylyltransferase [Actinomycetota bacterium]
MSAKLGGPVICPGSFDPVTLGHLDIFARASEQFESVVIAVLQNPAKSNLFSVEERMEMLKVATAEWKNIEVTSFQGLLVDFCKSRKINAIVKGLRAVSDFDYELQMAQLNHQIGGVETFFMSSNPTYSFLSSSMTKEVARYGGSVDQLVPTNVAKALKLKFGN